STCSIVATATCAARTTPTAHATRAERAHPSLLRIPRAALARGDASLPAHLLDHLVHARERLALHVCREPAHAARLLCVRLGAPAAVLLLGHVEQAKRDHLVLV